MLLVLFWQFQYKKDYELAKGKMVGFQSLQDDPKLVHYMNVAKMQSNREYKKAYEEGKTKYNTPLDMVNVVAAKKAQEIVSNTNYKNLLHRYTFLPDAISVERSKNMMQIQSDVSVPLWQNVAPWECYLLWCDCWFSFFSVFYCLESL